MIIKSKKTAEKVIENFQELFKYDNFGQKNYIYFEEKNTNNTLTIMKYGSGVLTTNRRGKDLEENGEEVISNEECVDIMYKNRAAINKIIKLRKANMK